MQGLTATRTSTLAIAALALAGLNLIAASAQAFTEVPVSDYAALLRYWAAQLRALAGSPPPVNLEGLPPECTAYRSDLQRFWAALADLMYGAAAAAERGDWGSFREAKSRAYMLVACGTAAGPSGSPNLRFAVEATLPLISAEPSRGGGVLVLAAALERSAPPGWGGIPSVSPKTPNITVPDLGSLNISVNPGGPGRASEGGSLQVGVGGAPTAAGVDVARLLDMLAMARRTVEATGSQAGSSFIPSLNPGLPTSWVPVAALAAAAAYAVARAARPALPSLAELRSALRILARVGASEVSARECYRIALGRVESVTGRRKAHWETPREYLGAVESALSPRGAEWFKDRTMDYEAEAYGGAGRMVEVGECRGGAWLRGPRPGRGR